VKTKNYITKTVSPSDIKRDWILIDAENQVLGRLATKISMILQGKTKAMYTPNMDTGDHVIIINAEKVKLTGNKMNDKQYIRHTTYPGGQRITTPRQVLEKKPEFIIEKAVKGMLPRTKLGREMYRKLHVFVGNSHPHEAQQPKQIKL
jgi:large subunit ribosomal protein L13